MRTQITVHNWNDSNGNPGGGTAYGNGFAISWQNGPLGQGADRKPPNGAFVEDVLQAVISRIEYYEASKFACAENAAALDALRVAASCLDKRTTDREARAVEGTHAQ